MFPINEMSEAKVMALLTFLQKTDSLNSKRIIEAGGNMSSLSFGLFFFSCL